MLSLFGGSALSVLTHLGLEGYRFLQKRGQVEESEEQTAAGVQKASYGVKEDWEHFALTMVLLAAFTVTTLFTDDAVLSSTFRDMALASVAWFTGRLTLKLGRS